MLATFLICLLPLACFGAGVVLLVRRWPQIKPRPLPSEVVDWNRIIEAEPAPPEPREP